jgi:hypothetical protein
VAAAVLLIVLYAAQGQMNAALGRVEVPGYPAASTGGVFTFSPFTTATNARTAWCVWHRFTPLSAAGAVEASSQDPGPAARTAACLKMLDTGVATPYPSHTIAATLLHSYVVVNTLFAIGFGLALYILLRRTRQRLSAEGDDPVGAGLLVATQRRFVAPIDGVLVAADLVENAVQWILANPNAAPTTVIGATNILFWATGLKWLAGSVGVLLLAIMALRGLRPAWAPIRKAAKHLRLPIAVLVIYGVILSGAGTDQVQDALLATSYGWRLMVFAVLAAAVLTLQVWRSPHRTVLTANDRTYGPLFPWVPPLVAVAAGVAGIFWRNLFGLAAVAALMWVLSWIAGAGWWRRYEPATAAGLIKARATTDARSQALPEEHAVLIRDNARRLAAVPFLLLGLFMLRSATATALLGPDTTRARTLVAVGAGLAIVAVFIPAFLHMLQRHFAWAKPPAGGGNHWLNLGVSLISAGVAVAVYAAPFQVPAYLGPIAMVMFFLGLLLAVLGELQRWAEYQTPVAGMRLLGFRRTPVFVLLAVWFVVASLADVDGHNEVRLLPSAQSTATTTALADEFQRWAAANCATSGTRSDEPAYLVVAAASGGGIRAAYWTAGVLDRVFPSGTSSTCAGADTRSPLFAISGISGGSVGAMAWLSHQQGGPTQWYKTSFGGDYLSPALSWLLYVDIPRAMIGFPGLDRAGVLEQAFEHDQPDMAKPFLEMYASKQGWTPLALLNGTVAESGCRGLVAPVSLGGFDNPAGTTACRRRPEDQPQTSAVGGDAVTLTDLVGEFLCPGNDVRRSTAAMLSARFPYITPSGQLKQCDGEGRASVVDGGYVDGTGALTAADLYEQLKPFIDCHNQAYDQTMSAACQQQRLGQPVPTRRIVPLFLQIDNGYDSVAAPSAPGRPHELLLPPMGYLNAADTASAAARQRAFVAFGCSAYLRIANQSDPALQAPLGWTLSPAAQSELDANLAQIPSNTLGQLHDAATTRCTGTTAASTP